MENQPKKLRLEELKVESFVTNTPLNAQTVQGGSGRWCFVWEVLNFSIDHCATVKDFSKDSDCRSAGGETYCCS
jgi:hypothetical protein